MGALAPLVINRIWAKFKKNFLGFSFNKSSVSDEEIEISADTYTLSELISKMEDIVGKWHPDTARSGGDGDAGNLLEDLLGVPENPLPVADYGIFEIKTHKRESNAKIKMFSLSPNPRPFSKKPFLEVVGWRDKNKPDTRKRFSYTKGVSGNARGFRIVRDDNTLLFTHDLERVERDGKCLDYEDDETYGEYSDRVRSHPNFSTELPKTWVIRAPYEGHKDNLEARIKDKLQNVFFVERTSRKNPQTGEKETKYHECWLLSTLRIERLIEYIDNDVLNVDFNMHTGHDHGVSFRIDKNRLHELFDNSEKVI